MTKLQIAAKSVLTGLIVYAVVTLLRPLAELPYDASAPRVPLTLFLAVVYVGLIVGAGLYLVMVSDRLVAGAVDRAVLAPERSRSLLAQALTLTMVSVGLLLLPKAVPMLVAILKVPFVLRPLISEAVIEGGLPSSLSASGTQWLRRLYACARLAATVYLLCGAPQLVRWQLRRAVNRKRRSD